MILLHFDTQSYQILSITAYSLYFI